MNNRLLATNRKPLVINLGAAAIALSFWLMTLPSARAADPRSDNLLSLPSQPLQVSAVPTVPAMAPKNAADFLKRGVEKVKTNDLEGAIVDFSQAIRLKLDYAAAYYNRAVTYANLNNPRAAIADYTQVVLLKPNNAYARYERGLIRADLGDQKGAIEDFQQAANLFKQQLNAKFQQKALDKLKQLQPL